FQYDWNCRGGSLMPGIARALTPRLWLLLAASAVVCPGQMPPSDSINYAAKVVTASGQVSVLRDSRAWALFVGDLVQVKELIVTGPDGNALFQVSDGSTFFVYPNSRVVFRKNPPNWKDLIDLLVGRVRVHIEHLGTVANPNRVLTPTAVISVRGTTFDVSVDDDDETTLIEVEEGVVEVRHALLPSDNPKVLTTGESLRVYKSQPIARRMLDKGTVWQRVVRAAADAVNTIGTRSPGTSGGGTGTGGGTVGDTGGGTAPPPPSPPPPPGPPGPP